MKSNKRHEQNSAKAANLNNPSNPKLKEYSCRIFSKLLNDSYTSETMSLRVEFKSSLPTKPLPKYIRDDTCSRVYLLKWTEGLKQPNSSYSQGDNDSFSFSLLLLEIVGDKTRKAIQPGDVLEVGNQNAWKFYFNYLPQHMCIVGDIVFFIAGNQVFAFNFTAPIQVIRTSTVIQNLSYKKVQQVSGLLQDGKPSVQIYCLDENNNLFSKQFAPFQSQSPWNTFPLNQTSKIKSFLKKSPQYLLFRVLVAKVVGIIFFDQKRWALINLKTFQLVPNSSNQLTGWALQTPSTVKIVIKNKARSYIEGSHFDDEITICIAGSEMLQLLSLKVKLKRNSEFLSQQNNIRQYRMTDILQQELVDWNQSVVVSECTICHGYQYLLDLQFVGKGFVVCGVKSAYSRIASYSLYPEGQKLYGESFQILTQETRVWHQHLKEQRRLFQSLRMEGQFEEDVKYDTEDFVFSSRGYPVPFILRSLGRKNNVTNLTGEDYDLKKLVFDWFKYFKLVKMFSYKGEFFILRQHSLSVLVPIGAMQYNSQNIQAAKLFHQLNVRDQPHYQQENLHHFQIDQSFNMSRISLNEPQKTQRIFINEPKLTSKQTLEVYFQAVDELRSCYDLAVSGNRLRNSSENSFVNKFIFPNYFGELLSNKVRDQIMFYYTFFRKYRQTFKEAYLNPNEDEQFRRIFNQNQRKTQLFLPIFTILQFYANLIIKNVKKQHEVYFEDIFSKFIKEQINAELIGDVGMDSDYVMGKLLQSLVPFYIEPTQNELRFSGEYLLYSDDRGQQTRNSFIEMLIEQHERGFRSLNKKILLLFVNILIKQKCIPLTKDVYALLNIVPANQMKKLLCKFILKMNEWKQLESAVAFESAVNKCTLNENQNEKEINEMLRTSYAELFTARQLLSLDSHDQAYKGILTSLIRNISKNIIQVPRYEDLINIRPENIDFLVDVIESKLAERKDISKLLEFQSLILKIRCQHFNNEVAHSRLSKQYITKLLYKCQVSLITFKEYFVKLYNNFSQFKSYYNQPARQFAATNNNKRMPTNPDYLQNDTTIDRLNDQWLLNSHFTPKNIHLLGKTPTLRLISLILVALKGEWSPENFYFNWNDPFSLAEFYAKLGNFLLKTAMEKTNSSLLEDLVRLFGVDQLSEWIMDNDMSSQLYDKNPAQFRALLKYSRANTQRKATFEQILPLLSYRNAHIETAILQKFLPIDTE